MGSGIQDYIPMWRWGGHKHNILTLIKRINCKVDLKERNFVKAASAGWHLCTDSDPGFPVHSLTLRPAFVHLRTTHARPFNWNLQKSVTNLSFLDAEIETTLFCNFSSKGRQAPKSKIENWELLRICKLHRLDYLQFQCTLTKMLLFWHLALPLVAIPTPLSLAPTLTLCLPLSSQLPPSPGNYPVCESVLCFIFLIASCNSVNVSNDCSFEPSLGNQQE